MNMGQGIGLNISFCIEKTDIRKIFAKVMAAVVFFWALPFIFFRVNERGETVYWVFHFFSVSYRLVFIITGAPHLASWCAKCRSSLRQL
jgi:hypothetical protein